MADISRKNMTTTYKSRFVEQYPSSDNTCWNDDKYPPGYDEATSISSASTRVMPSSTVVPSPNAQWPSHHGGQFEDPLQRVSSPSNPSRRPLPHPSYGQPIATAASPPPPETHSRARGGSHGGYERYVYTYRLVAGGVPLEFLVSVEPTSGSGTVGPRPGKYTFRLSARVGGIERPLGEPTTRMLKVDPRTLEFIVFVFPGKTSIPSGCLWSLRVWLRSNGVDHRIFGEDELWVGKDPDFNAIGDASFARLKHQDGVGEQVYSAFVGKALVNFTVKWSRVQGSLYRYSLDYEAGGVGANLFEDFRVRLDAALDPRSINFLIFTVPSNSVPHGASHRLRIWIRSLAPASSSAGNPSQNSYSMPFNDSYIYQRIWKTDDFKMGANLQFTDLGPKMIMGFGMGNGAEVVRIQTSGGGRGSGGAREREVSSLEDSKRAGYEF